MCISPYTDTQLGGGGGGKGKEKEERKEGKEASAEAAYWEAGTEPVYLTALPALYPDVLSSQSLPTRVMTALHKVQSSKHLKEKG